MLTNACVILPAAVASAFSSNVVRSSNHCSTLAALPLLTPRSMRLAPKEKNPFGIAITPDAIPDNIDSNVPTLLSVWYLLVSNIEAIYSPKIQQLHFLFRLC